MFQVDADAYASLPCDPRFCDLRAGQCQHDHLEDLSVGCRQKLCESSNNIFDVTYDSCCRNHDGKSHGQSLSG